VLKQQLGNPWWAVQDSNLRSPPRTASRASLRKSDQRWGADYAAEDDPCSACAPSPEVFHNPRFPFIFKALKPTSDLARLLLKKGFQCVGAMPQQIARLAILFALLGSLLFVARRYLVPKSFGDLGHYRASAVDDNANRPLVYAGHDVCNTCHSEIVEKHDAARHQTVACQVCHGAAATHAESPFDHKPPAPRQRGYCPLCHGYDPSRPTGFPQIDPVAHNPVQPCITCHDPHAPEPPRVPQECSACHGEIARTKALSRHAALPCTTCHATQEQHKVNPLLSRPNKPRTREFCGQCHAPQANSSPEIPRVDLTMHGGHYVCWQCHYSHYPEVL